MPLHCFAVVLVWICTIVPSETYYKRYISYGTGDTLVTMHGGGAVDDLQRWAVECQDGEAMVGFNDGGDYTSFAEVWCRFMFPKKKPSFGIYPYYDYCTVRDVSVMSEYYCYDKYYPIDTYDTFVTAFTFGLTFNLGLTVPVIIQDTISAAHQEVYKCCKLPFGYHLDYSRCQYKYTHDKFGEHYNENSMYIAKCDRDFVMTGIGRAENPWDGSYHYVWIQCCPVFYDNQYVPLYVTANATLHALAARPLKMIRRPAG